MKDPEMRTTCVGKVAVGLASICLFLAVLDPCHLQAQADRGEDTSYKDFIDGAGAMLYFLAWPSAEYDSVTFAGASAANGGTDVKIRLHGKSSFNDGYLWTELIVVFRDGEIRDIKWGRNNAILKQPGSTVTAFGEVLAELNAEYERSQSASGSPSSADPATTFTSLSIRSRCNENIFVVVLYLGVEGNWVRKGWFKVGHDDTIKTGITTGNDNVYFYAESGSSLQWTGEGRTGAVTRTVVGGKFDVADGNALTGSGLREASFFHADMTGSGSQYTQSLSCDHQH